MKEYGDNIVQLELEKQYLQELLELKNDIMQNHITYTQQTPELMIKKIFNPKTEETIKKTGIDCNFFIKGKNKKIEPMLDYLEDLEKNDIDTAIEKSKIKIKILEDRIKKYQIPLKTIQGYEKKIYLHILEGMNITKAVEKVAEETDKSDRQIWKYYNRLKKLLEKENIELEDKIIL